MKRAVLLVAVLLAAARPAAAGEIRPFTSGSWTEIRSAHAGHPTVVAMWSTSCVPCIAEMPLWRRLAEPDSGIDVVLVATDSINDAERLERVLERHGTADIETWAFAERHVERLRYEIDKSWRGELPRTYLLGADGTVSAVTGLIDEATVRRHLLEGSHGPRR